MIGEEAARRIGREGAAGRAKMAIATGSKRRGRRFKVTRGAITPSRKRRSKVASDTPSRIAACRLVRGEWSCEVITNHRYASFGVPRLGHSIECTIVFNSAYLVNRIKRACNVSLCGITHHRMSTSNIWTSRRVALNQDDIARLTQLAEKTGFPQERLLPQLVRAGLRAAERYGYRLVIPLEFTIDGMTSFAKKQDGAK